MRVLMLTDFYPPGVGGIERHVQTLSAELTRRGHQTAVVTLRQPGQAEIDDDGPVKVYRIRGTLQRVGRCVFTETDRPYAPPAPDAELTAALARIVAQERPQIVHGHDWLVRSFLPLKAWSGARLVVTLHYYNLACANKTLLRDDATCAGPGLAKCVGCAARHYGPAKGLPIVTANWAGAAAERALTDMYLCVSHAVAAGNGLVGGKTPYREVSNFIPDDINAAPADDPLLSLLPDEPYMLFVGALRRYKGIEVVLDAYRSLAGAPPLVLIGSSWSDSPTAFPCGVVALRNWPHAAVMSAWSRCLFGLAPSVWPEPCPTVVMEAMASGRPVIVSSLGGLPELVVDGVNGLVVPPNNVAALRQATARLLANTALRERLGNAARAMAPRFQAASVTPQVERAYDDVLRRGERSSVVPSPAGRGQSEGPSFAVPLVSVVIATRDRPAFLATCLDALAGQRYPRFEVIVVDNAPRSEATARLVAQRQAGGGGVRYVRTSRANTSDARNCGVAHAAGAIVAFIDDDAIADAGWLAALVAGFEAGPNVGCVTGLIVPLALETPAQRLFEQFGGFGKGTERRIYDLGRYRPPDPLFPYAAGKFGSGPNMAFRKEALHPIGGFDPALGGGSLAQGGEDLAVYFETIIRGFQLVYEPAALVRHAHRREYPALRRQIGSYGRGLAAYLTKCLLDHPALLLDVLPRVPAGLRYGFDPRSPKNGGKSSAYPGNLTRAEVVGMLAGPCCYIAGRAAETMGARHRHTVQRADHRPPASPVEAGEGSAD